jgi:hypothetical protein
VPFGLLRETVRYSCNTIQCVLWNGDPVEGCARAARIGRHRLDALTAASARRAVWLVRASICMSAIQ